jgi:hypothetical protein
MTDDAQVERKPKRQTKFDAAERERIRRALLAYARDNRIGAPNLQLHIAEKLGRTVDEVGALKTLQRFLIGEGRVNDGFVTVCAAFAERTGAMTPHDELARDLGEFFSRDGEDRPADEVPSRLAGDYVVWAGGKTFIDFKVEVKGQHVNPHVPYGRCRISGGGRGLKVHETEATPESNSADGTFRPAANDGMMLYFNPLIFMLLKNRLTRLPRVYWLRERQDGRLAGNAMHGIPVEPGHDYPPYSELRVYELRPVAKGAS